MLGAVLLSLLIASFVASYVVMFGGLSSLYRDTIQRLSLEVRRAHERLEVVADREAGVLWVTNLGSQQSLIRYVIQLNNATKELVAEEVDIRIGVGERVEVSYQSRGPEWIAGVVTALGNVFWDVSAAGGGAGEAANVLGSVSQNPDLALVAYGDRVYVDTGDVLLCYSASDLAPVWQVYGERGKLYLPIPLSSGAVLHAWALYDHEGLSLGAGWLRVNMGLPIPVSGFKDYNLLVPSAYSRTLFVEAYHDSRRTWCQRLRIYPQILEDPSFEEGTAAGGTAEGDYYGGRYTRAYSRRTKGSGGCKPHSGEWMWELYIYVPSYVSGWAKAWVSIPLPERAYVEKIVFYENLEYRGGRNNYLYICVYDRSRAVYWKKYDWFWRGWGAKCAYPRRYATRIEIGIDVSGWTRGQCLHVYIDDVYVYVSEPDVGPRYGIEARVEAPRLALDPYDGKLLLIVANPSGPGRSYYVGTLEEYAITYFYGIAPGRIDVTPSSELLAFVNHTLVFYDPRECKISAHKLPRSFDRSPLRIDSYALALPEDAWVVASAASGNRLYLLLSDGTLAAYSLPSLTPVSRVECRSWYPAITAPTVPSVTTWCSVAEDIVSTAISTPILWVDGLGLVAATNRGLKIFDENLNLKAEVKFEGSAYGQYSIAIAYSEAEQAWYIATLEIRGRWIKLMVYYEDKWVKYS